MRLLLLLIAALLPLGASAAELDPIGPRPGEGPTEVIGAPSGNAAAAAAADKALAKEYAAKRAAYLVGLAKAMSNAAEATAARDAEIAARHAAER